MIREPIELRPIPSGSYDRPSILLYIDELEQLLSAIDDLTLEWRNLEDVYDENETGPLLQSISVPARKIRDVYNHCIIGSETEFYRLITRIIESVEMDRSYDDCPIVLTFQTVEQAVLQLREYIETWKLDISSGNLSVNDRIGPSHLT